MPKQPVCGNTPALSRRNVITGLAALPATSALPFPAQAAHFDPVVQHYHEWLDARRDWRAREKLPDNRNHDTPEMLEAEARETEAENQMLQLTPTTLEGIAAMVSLAWCYQGPCTTDPEMYANEASSVDCQAMMAIWRACTGQDGYPVT